MERFIILGVLLVVLGMTNGAYGAISRSSLRKIHDINKEGPYYGIIVPNTYEMNPLLESSSFQANETLPYLDVLGRRFRFGRVDNKKVIIVMTGLSMLNAGVTTELLLTLFRVQAVLHYGIAGNANSQLQIGDVTIPKYWAHSALWNWQRFGDGPEDELALESDGDYTRTIGYLKIPGFNNLTQTNGEPVENYLNNVWYQPEEVFPIDGTPEVRQHAFWVPVNEAYYNLSSKISGVNLTSCVNTTCLPRAPLVIKVERGLSANIYLDNKAYREFLHSKFNATPVDMETAAIALTCYQLKMPFIAFRSLSDLAGGGSSISNEASTFSSLAAQNAVDVLIKFMQLLS